MVSQDKSCFIHDVYDGRVGNWKVKEGCVVKKRIKSRRPDYTKT